jgi:hypothetical protein
MTQDWREKLKFPEREIPRYSVMVEPSELVVGEVYFRLSYLDEAMTIPELVPLVFIGRDLEPESDGSHRSFFQDAASYRSGVRWGDEAAQIAGETEEERFESWLQRGHIETFDESGGGVHSFERALDLLLLCSLERGSGKRVAGRSREDQ